MLSVEQHVASAVDLGGEIIGAAVIGVELLHQAAVRRPDRLGIGARGEAEDIVCRLLLENKTAARRRRGATPRASEILMPIGIGAIEIGLDEPRALLVLGAAFAQ